MRHSRQATGNGEQGKRSILQVRIGIHTGLVVIGEIGTSEKSEMLALGETPNVAARIQGLAEPNTVLISAATQRLVGNQFECQPFGSHLVKGIDTPIAVYHVQGKRQSIVSSIGHTTPLVGRDQEVGLLRERWEQVKDGRGQVVLLTGEPGIGKSRLMQTLTEHVASEGSLALETRCSPYHQNSAFYPLIDAMQRMLFTREDSVDTKVEKLARTLALYNMQDTLPLFAALLSLPLPAATPPLQMTPQKQKERTIRAMVQWWLAQAERQATVSVWEDLHWADPSTLEFLTLLLEQAPTSRLFVLLTARPEFISPWPPRSHFVTLTLNRLGRRQTEAMIAEVAGEITLPTEVTQQILAKTDGVPLFVEEVTKTVLESVASLESTESPDRLSLQSIPIPTTLQDSLMARLDRLNTAKELAQLGATLGREFSYELLQAISPLAEDALQQGLRQLVESELVYQRGLPPQAQYTFKHALIQDAAYQSLLKSRRQQLHQQIARILEERYPETKETQPELLAHHYTEARLSEQAIPYWQQAGQRAVERSANQEAIGHLSEGLELLKTFPDTPERALKELTLQIMIGPALIVTKGFAAPEVGYTYTRARQLCQHIEESPQLFSALHGLFLFSSVRAELQTAQEVGEQLVSLAQTMRDPALLLVAHQALGLPLLWRGELTQARDHLEQGIACYDSEQYRSLALRYGYDPAVAILSWIGHVWWYLGYPDRALTRSREALALAQRLSHPYSLAFALGQNAWIHLYRQEWQVAQEQAEAVIALCADQGFAFFFAWGTMIRGRALAKQGQGEGGIAQDAAGLSRPSSHRGREYLAVLSCMGGRDTWTNGTWRGRIKSAGRGAGYDRQNWGAVVRSRTVPPQRRAAAGAGNETGNGGRATRKSDRSLIPDARCPRRGRFDTKDLQEAKALLEELSH